MKAAEPSIRDRLLGGLAAHVLAHGLAAASLRPLARSAGTSDRMLIYHFGSKGRLLDALLLRLAHDLERALTLALPTGRARSCQALVAEVLALLRSAPLRPYMRVWLEIAAAAAQGQRAQRATGRRILGLFLPWIAARLPARVRARQRTAAALLAVIEGAILLDAVGMSDAADMAVAETARFDRAGGH